jgi:hypothetical protein
MKSGNDSRVNVVESGRAAFLSTFRWVEGHPDLGQVFVNAGSLALLGPALAQTGTPALNYVSSLW